MKKQAPIPPKQKPPHWADQLLERFCRPELLPEIQGDLHELFMRWVKAYGVRRARWLYVWNVITFFRPFAITTEKPAYAINSADMLKNYFKIAFRNLVAKKFYSLINMSGLSIGLTCCMLIFLYVQHELSYDIFHTKAHRIYRLVTDAQTSTQTSKSGMTTAAMASSLKAEFPEVENMVRLLKANYLLEKDELKFQEDHMMFADAGFFEVFDFPLLQGHPQKALDDPFSIVLTQEAARKYFGEENPIGKRLQMDDKYDMTVTGVIQNVPEHSHFTFDMLISMSTLLEKIEPKMAEDWSNFGFSSYVLLSERASPTKLEGKLPVLVEKHTAGLQQKMRSHYSLFLEPLTDIYLHSNRFALIDKKGNLTNIYIFSIIAGFILLIACINFINLATARATERAKEVGIRKVIGAIKRQLTLQFLCESILLSLLAFALAMLLSELLLPAFNQLSGKTIITSIFDNNAYLLLFSLVTLGVGFLAGIYPALVLASFKPVSVLKGRFSSSRKGLLLRKGLVIVQFVISIMLIAGTTIVYLQLDYMRNQELGFKKDQMLIIDFQFDEAIFNNVETVKRQLSSIPQVVSASASLNIPSIRNYGAYTEIENAEGDMQASGMDASLIDYDFIDQYQIEIIAGRNFSKDFPADSAQALIINEAAVASLGYASPEEVVGKHFIQDGKEGQIIGVVKDFHYRSLQEAIEPSSFRIATKDLGYIPIRYISLNVETQDITGTIAQLEQKWQEVAPHRPFNYFFLDEAFDQQYKAEMRFGQLFIYFAGLAIFIACLGLLGLISYTVVQRTREIGIRKVLGATESSIVRLLSKDLITLIFFAFVIASPVAWFVMNRWLQGYAYRIDIHWWMFSLAGILTLAIAIFTMSFQSIKAALANPVDSLRDE